MNARDRVAVWWGLSLYYKWELLGVWCRVRCSACGGWKWGRPCYADGHGAGRGHPDPD